MNSFNNNELEQNDTTKSTEKKCANESCCGIYGLRNKTTGKWYVGQSVNIQRRKWAYRSLRCKAQPKIYNALKKYGIKDFDFLVLEECERCFWILDYREIYWIRLLNSYNSGYNLTTGGGNSPCSKLTKEKLRSHNLGKKASEETKRRMSISMTGKRLSEERKTNISKAKKGKPLSMKNRIALTGKKRSEEAKQKMREKALLREERKRRERTLIY